MDQQGMQHFRAEVLARKNLPTIPAVLARVLQLSDSVDASGKELIAVIEKDQALTGKMLRLANSAFFGQSRAVATIPRAVILLGFSTVRNLALGVKVWDAFGGGVSKSVLETLWGHSVAVGMVAKKLAARLRVGDPDEAFTAGLLHDVGRLVLAMRFREEYWKATGGVKEVDAVDERERESFGVDHAEVGSWMLEAWALPVSIVEAVRSHHEAATRPETAGPLALADRLVAWTNPATGELAPEAGPLLEATTARGLGVEAWTAAFTELRESGALNGFPLQG
jgi:putative nucleotidyltransferase with HDIG domain